MVPKNKMSLSSSIKKALSNIHEKYVLVPADKAANNAIIVWKKFYVDVLSNELKSIHTYKKVNNSEMEIFDSHDSFNNKHGIKVEDDFKNLPSIHWLPKVHKKPYKFRHIVNSRPCSTKELSIRMTLVLLLFSYCLWFLKAFSFPIEIRCALLRHRTSAFCLFVIIAWIYIFSIFFSIHFMHPFVLYVYVWLSLFPPSQWN